MGNDLWRAKTGLEKRRNGIHFGMAYRDTDSDSPSDFPVARVVREVANRCLKLQSANRVAETKVFAFFSSRAGCLGSLVISIIGTALLILIMRGCHG